MSRLRASGHESLAEPQRTRSSRAGARGKVTRIRFNVSEAATDPVVKMKVRR